MGDAITEEQERVVMAARSALTHFDTKPPLFRWLENYSPSHGKWFWSTDWHVVTREGQHWKVEIGGTDSDRARETILVDGRAPAPPVMEHRPPKPEPVKAREISPRPMKVPSALEYIHHMLSHSEIMELHQMLRERMHRRRPIYRQSVFSRFDEEMSSLTFETEPDPLSDLEMMALAHSILDRRFRTRPPPMREPVRPPAPPTRRNQ